MICAYPLAVEPYSNRYGAYLEDRRIRLLYFENIDERFAHGHLSLRMLALVRFDVELDVVRAAPSSRAGSFCLILSGDRHRKHSEQRHYEDTFHESPPASGLCDALKDENCYVRMYDVEPGQRVSILVDRVRKINSGVAISPRSLAKHLLPS